MSLEINPTNGKSKEETISFSDALDRTLYGKFNYFVIVVAGLVMANVLLETSAVAFFMPVAACELELTNSRKGLLSCISYVGMISTSHLWGFLADTKGRKRIMQPTMIAAFVMTVLASFATEFWSMLVLRLINGIFICGASAVVYAYLGELHSDRTRSKVLMISSIIYALGALIMPFISFAVINREWSFPISFMGLTYKPWRLFLIVCGIPGLVAAIALSFLPESPKYLLSSNREDEAREVIQKIYRMNGGSGKLELPRLVCEEDSNAATDTESQKSKTLWGFLKSMWNQTVPLFQRKYIRSTAIVCITQFWMYVISNGLYMWFPYIINVVGEFMKANPGENELICNIVHYKHATIFDENSTLNACPDKLEEATYMYSLILEIVFVLFFAIISLIVNRVGKILIMFVLILFTGCCGFIAVFLPFTAVAAIFYCLIFEVGVTINVLGAATVDLYPTQLRATALAVSLMVGRIGSMVGTNIVGSLLAKNCEMTFYISCSAMMVCAILILFLPKNIQPKKLCDDADT